MKYSYSSIIFCYILTIILDILIIIQSIPSKNNLNIDNVKPQIKLNGELNINIFLNDKYNEPGYTATDNIDGDLTDKVNIIDNIKNEVGTYEIIYKVTDSSNNIDVKRRTINVLENNNGIIYLTFDDGPSSITDSILDILKKYNIKATFFVVNNIYFDKMQKIIEEGHTVGIHSYSHIYKDIYLSVDNYFNDLTKLENKLKQVKNIQYKIIRFPGGSSNTISSFNKGIMTKLTNEVEKRGYHYFDWDIDSNDASFARSSIEVYNNVIYNLSKNRSNVILMHDSNNNYKTLNSLEDIINYAIKKGYTFSNITYYTPMVKHNILN